MSSSSARKYVVETKVNGCTLQKIWNTENPLSLGHPAVWTLSVVENGVEVRKHENTVESLERDRHIKKRSGLRPWRRSIRVVGFIFATTPALQNDVHPVKAPRMRAPLPLNIRS